MFTILVADDEDYLRLLITATIESEQYRVLQATDGCAAWELIQQHRPDLAILDVMMPGLTGLEIAHAAKSDPALSGIRIVLLTANGQDVDRALGLAAGADRYMTKPFSAMELQRAVEQLLAATEPASAEAA